MADDATAQASVRIGASAGLAPGRVARVCVLSPLPHLDRLFEYAIPQGLRESVRPGVRVRVRFAGRRLDGFVIEVTDAAEFEGTLQPVARVVSDLPVLAPQVWRLARAAADRQAGIAADVLRLAVPPRHARAEAAWRRAAGSIGPEQWPDAAARTALSTAVSRGARAQPEAGVEAESGAEASGEPPAEPQRVWSQPRVGCVIAGTGDARRPVPGWTADAVAAARSAVATGHGALLLVPDERDADALMLAAVDAFGADAVARGDATGDDAGRYRDFLRIRSGQARVVVGTRSAAYAPVASLGRLVMVDDGDPSYIEQHAPFIHTRDVALLRQRQEGCDLLFLSSTRSVAVHRLVRIGYVRAEPAVRGPRVILAAAIVSDDPLVAQARIPQIAFNVARAGLADGPVLVQVGRAGFQRREVDAEGDERVRPGAGRTAEDLGRAFSDVPVVVSTADHRRDSVSEAPQLVVSTAGVEPCAPGGYRAVVILDALTTVSREGLFASEHALRHWFNAAVLAAQGAQVVLTGVEGRLARAMVAWDPAVFAEDELAQRAALGFPPAVRFFTLACPAGASDRLLASARLPDAVRVLAVERSDDPLPGGELVRLSVPYSVAAAAAAALKALIVRCTTGPAAAQTPVRVHADDVRGL